MRHSYRKYNELYFMGRFVLHPQKHLVHAGAKTMLWGPGCIYKQ